MAASSTGHAPNARHLLRQGRVRAQRGVLETEERTWLCTCSCPGSCPGSCSWSGSRAFHRRNSLKENGFRPASARGLGQLTSWSPDGVRRSSRSSTGSTWRTLTLNPQPLRYAFMCSSKPKKSNVKESSNLDLPLRPGVPGGPGLCCSSVPTWSRASARDH